MSPGTTIWRQKEYLRKILGQLKLKEADYSRQVSKIRETDVWLGYVLTLRE